MAKTAERVARQASEDAPPPYTEVPNNVQLSRPVPSTVSPLQTGYSANNAPSRAVIPEEIASRTSTTKLREAQPSNDRGRPSEGSATYSSAVAVARDAASDVPPGAHLVKAPYELKQKNSSIYRDLLVFASDTVDTSVPDVRLRTKNALIQSAVYINDQHWGRPVSVHAETKNADLILGIHTLQADQAVRLRASTKNGRGRIFLPRDFQGLLAVSTKNGKCTLSADLKRVAVRVPSQYQGILQSEKLFGRSDSPDFRTSSFLHEQGNGVDVWYEINGGGPSAAVVDTKNGNVWAGFVGNNEASCSPNCSIM